MIQEEVWIVAGATSSSRQQGWISLDLIFPSLLARDNGFTFVSYYDFLNTMYFEEWDLQNSSDCRDLFMDEETKAL